MDKRKITVKGIGSVSVSPDLVVLELGLEVVEPDYEMAMIRAAERLDMLRAATVTAGHDGKSLKTTRFNVSTEYKSYRDKNDNWRHRFVGYGCKHDLRLEFDFDMSKLGVTLGAIAKCEADPKIKIEFSVKDPSAVSERLLVNAIDNAKRKAEILAKSSGVRLGRSCVSTITGASTIFIPKPKCRFRVF